MSALRRAGARIPQRGTPGGTADGRAGVLLRFKQARHRRRDRCAAGRQERKVYAVIDGIPVIDAVVHPYNLSEENFRTAHARPITDIVSGGNRAVAPPGYRLPKDGYERNWSIEEV